MEKGGLGRRWDMPSEGRPEGRGERGGHFQTELTASAKALGWEHVHQAARRSIFTRIVNTE